MLSGVYAGVIDFLECWAFVLFWLKRFYLPDSAVETKPVEALTGCSQMGSDRKITVAVWLNIQQ